MITLVTSCGREDLLFNTIGSLLIGQPEPLSIVIHEDSPAMTPLVTNIPCIYTGGCGQHKSIEIFLEKFKEEKFYLHCEDDWQFRNSYNWIDASLRIMAEDPTIIKVLARKNSPHPCKHDRYIRTGPDSYIQYGLLQPWTGADNIWWGGFSWNPGVTRLDLLRQFIPFPKFEQDLAERIYSAGYKVVELAEPIYEHIGEGRSTH